MTRLEHRRKTATGAAVAIAAAAMRTRPVDRSAEPADWRPHRTHAATSNNVSSAEFRADSARSRAAQVGPIPWATDCGDRSQP
jgi:hypothetical protein